MARAAPGDDALRGLPRFVAVEDERIRAATGAADTALSADRPGDLLPALRELAAAHPFHEPLQASLLDCLTGAGRTAEALALFDRTRTRLRDELGIDPGPALADAQARALASPSTPPPAPRPAQLPASLPGFAGRHDLLAALREVPGILLITGMAGVGKTTLALRHAARLAPDYPDGQLYVNLRGFDATSAPTEPLAALGDMLEGLGVPWPGQPGSVDGRAGLLRSILARKRVLVVLDNAHGYQQVEPLLPGAGPSRVIVTSRNGLPGLVAFHHAQLVALEPFDDNEVVEFFGHRLASARVADNRDAVIRLGRACAGLPLALAIVVARAAVNPNFPLDLLVREFTLERSRLDQLNAGSADLDLSTVFSWSQRGLSADAARTFAALSVHPGPEISLAAAISLSGLDPRRTRAVLTELTLASVLREPRPDRFAFHDLVREYALHLLADNATEVSARLVNHYVRSTRAAILSYGQPAVAPVAEPLPGVRPETCASSRDASRWYAEERQVLHQVCRLADRLGDHRSALLLMLDWRPMSQSVDARHDMLPFAELAIGALERVAEPALRAECYREVASNFARTGQLDRARSYFDQAATTFGQAGDRIGQANVYRSMAVTLAMDPDERVGLLRESVAIARQLDDRSILATALQSLGLGLLWANQFADALTAFAECAAIAASTPDLSYLEPHVLSGRSRALAGAGRLAESAEAATSALALLRQLNENGPELRLLRSHGDVLTALGRTREAAQVWRRFLALARSPELVRETNAVDDDTAGSTTIDRIRAKLAELT